jgi:DNA repair protein SbcC/Rad50
MIPIRLELTDFLSYRGFHALDFASIHVASIVGPNGSGKSALLDAISWVLFGRSREHRISGRKTNKQRDAVINDLADSCEVSLEFEVEGNRFLVNRAIDRGKGGLRVQFKRLTPSGEENIREKGNIDHLIEKEIGITHDVFFSSSFITQGDSSRFMEASVAGRLEVLSEILDLSAYDDCLTETKIHIKETESNLKILLVKIEELEEVSKNIPELEEKLRISKIESEALDSKWNNLREQIDKTKKTLLELTHKKKIISENKVELEKIIPEISKLKTSITEIETEIKKLSSIIEQSEIIEDGFLKYKTTQKKLDSVNEKKSKHETLSTEISKLETLIKIEKSKISTSIESLTSGLKILKIFIAENKNAPTQLKTIISDRKSLEIIKSEIEKLNTSEREVETKIKALDETRDSLSSQASRLLIETGFSEISDVISELDFLEKKLENKLSEVSSKLDSSLEYSQKLRDDISRIETNIEHIHEELKLLESGDGGECPLCGSELPGSSAQKLIDEKKSELNDLSKQKVVFDKNLSEIENETNKLKHEQKELQKRKSQAPTIKQIVEIQNQTTTIETQLIAEREALEKIFIKIKSIASDNENLLMQADSLENHFVNLSGVVKNLDEKTNELKITNDSLKDFKEKLDGNFYCENEQAELKNFRNELEKNAFDTVVYQNLMTEEKELREFQQKKQELTLAHEKQITKVEELKKSGERITELKNKQKELTTKTKSLGEIESELTEKNNLLESLETSWTKVRTERDTAISTVQKQTSLLENANSASLELIKARKISDSLTTDSEILKRLKIMFGRDGIPNQILEGVVPQLEEIANEILEQISKGRHGGEAMRMRFELSRESATGKINTALDIILSDGLNERPYELFSGGERFRADFAIRLALSHILSRRSGRRLRLLVVDEGFGTQDAEGVSALVSAIHDVSSDFEKVLVVSHVDEIKNRFDRQIQVWRDSEGSHFELV